MSFPWSDWQFWVVTASAVAGVAVIVRPFLPRRGGDDAPCANCAVGAATHAALNARRKHEPSPGSQA